MLSILLRRLLWTLPTLFVVSVVTFLVLSFVPDRQDAEAQSLERDPAALEQHRRARFLDLPRFVNTEPLDVRARSERAVQLIAEGGPGALEAERELVRLGGAALPHVVPKLDELEPDRRASVALALAPVADRMGLSGAEDARSPGKAATFWTRFWSARSVEFRTSSVRTDVERLARYRSASRAVELEELDTFVLPAVMDRLEPPRDELSLQVARTLVDLAAHVTGRGDRIHAAATLAEAQECVVRWHGYWLIHQSDFVAFDGADRAAAMLTDTRYAKWAAGAALDVTVGAKKSDRTYARVAGALPTTLTLVFGGIALGYALAITLGTLASIKRQRALDIGLGALVVGFHSVPAAALAIAVSTAFASRAGLLLPTLVVAAGLVASPARQQKSALATVLERDFVRAARARGASQLRALVFHGLRHALFTVATLVTVEPPVALGAAFVVERVFRLDGLGELTVDAVFQRDTSFLMGLSLGAALLASLFVLVTDLIYAILDPRLRGRIGARSE